MSDARVMWATFATTLTLTLMFGVVMWVWNFGIIDEMFVASEISEHLSEMTMQQKTAHIWLTATVDVVYPFAYGSFFIGVALKFFPRVAAWLVLPSVLVVPVDLVEGFAQVMLLNGHDAYMGVKIVVTPLKLLLFIAGLSITILGLLRGLISLLRSRVEAK